jgi:hypothetical protein
MLEWVDREIFPELKRGSVFTDPEGNLDGYVLFYEGEVKDGTGSVAGKSLFAHYLDMRTSGIKTVSPTMIWDLAEGKGGEEESFEVDSIKSKVLQHVISGLRGYMGKIQTDRDRQAQIKEKYGIRSLDKLVVDLDGDLIRLYDRKERGSNVDLVIRNKEEQKRKYEKGREELQDIINKERNLTMSMPLFLGTIRVKPAIDVADPLHRD